MMKFLSIFTLLLSTSASAATMDDVFQADSERNMVSAITMAKRLAGNGDPEAQLYLVGIMAEGKSAHLAHPQPYNAKAIEYAKKCASNRKSTTETKGECFRVLSVLTMREKDVDEDAKAKLSFQYLWQAARIGNEQALKDIHSTLCKGKEASCSSEIDEMLQRCPDGPCAKSIAELTK